MELQQVIEQQVESLEIGGTVSGSVAGIQHVVEQHSDSATAAVGSLGADGEQRPDGTYVRKPKPPSFESQLRDNFDLIVDLLEERILIDLERRGGRFRGEF